MLDGGEELVGHYDFVYSAEDCENLGMERDVLDAAVWTSWLSERSNTRCLSMYRNCLPQ